MSGDNNPAEIGQEHTSLDKDSAQSDEENEDDARQHDKMT